MSTPTPTPAQAVPVEPVLSTDTTASLTPTLPSPTGTPAPTPSPTPIPIPEYLVLISIDGGRPEYFDLADMPNLDELRSRGTYYADAWVGALHNNTPTGHTQMSTGSFPKHNGITDYTMPDLSTGEIYQPTTEEAINAGEMAAIVERSGVPTLAGLFKAKFPNDKVIALSAHKYYAAQALGMGPADYILYSVDSEDDPDVPRMTAVHGHVPDLESLSDPRIEEAAQLAGQSNGYALTVARVMFERYQPRALLINLPEADDRGHTTGGLSAPVVIRKVMDVTDRRLGELMQAYRDAGVFDRTLWVITADHGMTPKKDLLVADDLFAQLGIQEESSDMLRLPEARLADPSRVFEIADMLAASHTPGILGVYVRTENAGMYSYQPSTASSGMLTPELDAAYRYLLDTYANRFSPDIVAMTAEGVVFDKDLNGTGGSHNEINWANQHIFALFSGPGIAAGQTSYAPARLVDLAPTIARLMEMPVDGMDGVPLADAMLKPSAEDMADQQASDAQIAPLRDALEANSLR